MRNITYTLPVSRDGQWTRGEDPPRWITGEMHFRAHQYTPHDPAVGGVPDRWITARFYFDPGLWDVDQHGLIYTDPVFLNGLHNRLQAAGWMYPDKITYSEQGMQGTNYVDVDVHHHIGLMMDLLISQTPVHTRWPEFDVAVSTV